MGDRGLLRLPIVTRIGAAGRAGDWALALALWEATAKRTPAACAATLLACARSKQWQRALDVLWEWFPADTSRSLKSRRTNFLATAPAKAAVQAASVGRNWELTVALLEFVRPTDSAVRTSAMSAVARCEQWKAAAKIFDETSFKEGKDESAEVVISVIRTFEQVGDYSGVNAAIAKLFPSMGPLEKQAFNAALSALARGQQAASASQLWNEKDRVKDLDASSYAAYMQVAARQGEWEAGLRLLSECKAMDLLSSAAAKTLTETKLPKQRRASVPSGGEAAVFSSALAACGAAGRWTLAMHLLHEAERCSVADVPCRNAAITALAKSGLWTKALAMLGDLGASRTIVSWNATLTACAEAGEWQVAMQLLEQMGRLQTFPDTISYNTAIAACKNSGQWVEALVILDELKAAARPSTYSSMKSKKAVDRPGSQNDKINSNSRSNSSNNNNNNNHNHHNRHSSNCSPDESTYTAALTALERGGQPARAGDLFWEALREGLALTTPVANAALMASSRAADWQQSLAILHFMEAQRTPKDRLTSRSFLRCMERTKRYREAAAALPLFAGWLDAEDIERLADMWEPHLWTEQPLSTAPDQAIAGANQKLNQPDSIQEESSTTLATPPPATAATTTTTTAAAATTKTTNPHHRPPYKLPKSIILDAAFDCSSWVPDAAAPGRIDLSQIRFAVEKTIPGAQVWPLGSAAEKLMVQGSDADVTVILPGEEGKSRTFEESRAHHQHVLRMLRPALATTEGVQVTGLISETRVPVLQLLLPGNISADLSVENRQGCRKSSFISEHLRLSPFGPELRETCLGIKHWAKRRGVYGQMNGFPSGLGFACLTIFAAQCGDPTMALTLDPTQVHPYAQEWSLDRDADKELVGRLLQLVFMFYAEELDWSAECVSARVGRRCLRAQLPKFSSAILATPPDVLSIEDPVQTDLDLGSPYMDAHRSAKLHLEFRRAADLAQRGRWSEICLPDAQQSPT